MMEKEQETIKDKSVVPERDYVQKDVEELLEAAKGVVKARIELGYTKVENE